MLWVCVWKRKRERERERGGGGKGNDLVLLVRELVVVVGGQDKGLQ